MSTSAEAADRRFVGTRAEGLTLLLFTACSWGLTWPQSKYLLSLLPPFTMRTASGFAGCLFAFGIAALRRERLVPPKAQWAWLLVFAMLNYGVFIVLTTQALVWLSASEAVLITYTLPIWAAILAWPMLGERPTWRQVAAILLGLGGVALMVNVVNAEARWEKLPGAAMALASALLFGLGTVLAKKHPLRLPPATSVAWQAGLGIIPVALLSTREHAVWSGVTPVGWASLAYIATLPLSAAYLAWFRALKLVPASTAATTVLISPMIGVLGSGLLLGEPLGMRQLVALALTLTGVALAATR